MWLANFLSGQQAALASQLELAPARPRHTAQVHTCPGAECVPVGTAALAQRAGADSGRCEVQLHGCVGHGCLKQAMVATTGVKAGPGGCEYGTGNAQARLYPEQEQAEETQERTQERTREGET